nr:LysM peptidoglycan-binding domain-containing protein [Clostridium ganghwense]
MLGSILVAAVPFTSGTAFAATSPATTSEASYTNYTILKGDSLWLISQKFDIPIDEIKSTNNLITNDLYINQVLKIPTKTVDTNIYEVNSGDTLSKIAQTFGITVAAIKEANNLSSDMIYVGQKLTIPETEKTSDTSTYEVKSGDTLWRISQKYDISVDELKRINNLTTDALYVGQILKLIGDVEGTEPTITYATHSVKSGENLWTISVDYGIPMPELLTANGLSSDSVLSIGQELTIPVHNIPVKPTIAPQYGEYLDWWKEAQYVFTIDAVAKVTDFHTGKTFMVKRTIGANHADCEPLTASDTAIAKEIWAGFSWNSRPVLIEVNGHKIAASMSFMPHSIQYITDNNFDGHFDIHFLNSTRHKDGEIDYNHQDKIKISAGINK